MTALLAILLIILVISSLIVQKDLFSPSKFYLLYLIIYLSDVFINDQNYYVYMAYSLYLAIGYVFVVLDKSTPVFQAQRDVRSLAVKKNRILITIWAFTLITVFAQLYLIVHFGGMTEYLNSIQGRVLGWQGLGGILILKQIAPLANIIYFSIGLQYKITSKGWWTLFVVNTLIVVLLGLLSGSRGATLMGLANLVIAWNYFGKKVSMKFALTSVAILVFAAAALGGMRNYQISDGTFSVTELADRVNFAEVKIFKYGIIPLDMLAEPQAEIPLKYGSTFLSAITRFAPRQLFPNKLKTGGEVLTEYNQGLNYTGTVNYSTGLLVESILNFGYVLGPAVFVALMLFFMMLSIRIRYTFLNRRREGSVSAIKYLYVYLTFAALPGALLMAEWTNLMVSTIINLCFFIMIYLSVSSAIRWGRPTSLSTKK